MKITCTVYTPDGNYFEIPEIEAKAICSICGKGCDHYEGDKVDYCQDCAEHLCNELY